MKPIVVLSSLLSLSYAFPQSPEWALAGSAASRFGSAAGSGWAKSGGGGKGFGSTKETEELQYQVLENKDVSRPGKHKT